MSSASVNFPALLLKSRDNFIKEINLLVSDNQKRTSVYEKVFRDRVAFPDHCLTVALKCTDLSERSVHALLDARRSRQQSLTSEQNGQLQTQTHTIQTVNTQLDGLKTETDKARAKCDALLDKLAENQKQLQLLQGTQQAQTGEVERIKRENDQIHAQLATIAERTLSMEKELRWRKAGQCTAGIGATIAVGAVLYGIASLAHRGFKKLIGDEDNT